MLERLQHVVPTVCNVEDLEGGGEMTHLSLSDVCISLFPSVVYNPKPIFCEEPRCWIMETHKLPALKKSFGV